MYTCFRAQEPKRPGEAVHGGGARNQSSPVMSPLSQVALAPFLYSLLLSLPIFPLLPPTPIQGFSYPLSPLGVWPEASGAGELRLGPSAPP
jgi:hypothetical protein